MNRFAKACTLVLVSTFWLTALVVGGSVFCDASLKMRLENSGFATGDAVRIDAPIKSVSDSIMQFGGEAWLVADLSGQQKVKVIISPDYSHIALPTRHSEQFDNGNDAQAFVGEAIAGDSKENPSDVMLDGARFKTLGLLGRSAHSPLAETVLLKPVDLDFLEDASDFYVDGPAAMNFAESYYEGSAIENIGKDFEKQVGMDIFTPLVFSTLLIAVLLGCGALGVVAFDLVRPIMTIRNLVGWDLFRGVIVPICALLASSICGITVALMATFLLGVRFDLFGGEAGVLSLCLTGLIFLAFFITALLSDKSGLNR